jgi:biopolymer transport protein ExbB
MDMEDIVYLMLGLTSLVGLTFIIERGIALRWRRVVPTEIEDAVESCQSLDDVPMLSRVCERHKSPMGRLLLLAAEHLDWPKAENTDALQTRARHEIARLERGLVVLEIIVGIAPLLGLVGTILGMMTAFGNVGRAGQIDAAELAKGISLILRATLMGLLIAIPSLIFWSYYSKKVETIAVEMETRCDEFIRRLYREGNSKPETRPAATARQQAGSVKSEVRS